LFPVHSAKQDVDGASRKPTWGGRRRREVGRRRKRRQAGHVLGGREHRTRLGVPEVLQVMDGVDGALAREDREQEDECQDQRPRPVLSCDGRRRGKGQEGHPDPRGRWGGGLWAFLQIRAQWDGAGFDERRRSGRWRIEDNRILNRDPHPRMSFCRARRPAQRQDQEGTTPDCRQRGREGLPWIRERPHGSHGRAMRTEMSNGDRSGSHRGDHASRNIDRKMAKVHHIDTPSPAQTPRRSLLAVD
jgi:hypothetical protein